MEPFVVQNLRYKLQKRISRLNAASDEARFKITLIQFWRFYDDQPILVGIKDALLAAYPEAASKTEKMLKEREQSFGESEEEAVALGYFVLRQLDKPNEYIFNLGYDLSHTGKIDEALDVIRDYFLTPFYEYIDEQLDDRRAMLSLLVRYKHRSEWFHRSRLWDLSQVEWRGEKNLALDLYSYLHDQGIDFTIEPSSITGEIDLIAGQQTSDPLLLDAKIFDGEGRGKSYIRKGFNQIYTYTQQYNEPFGYLVVFKTVETDLCFSLKASGQIPYVVHNHKTIFLLTIDIHPNPKPASQRGQLKAVEITEEELVGAVEERAKNSND
jgi:hypothetical protein